MLSLTAQYALRIMSTLALRQPDKPLRATEMAKEFSCSAPYLSKVLRQLVEAGLLEATKGHGGGFSLARPAEKILFKHILDAVDEDSTTRSCIFGWRKCMDSQPCILHHRFQQVRESFLEWSKTTSLDSVREDAKSMKWITNTTRYNVSFD